MNFRLFALQYYIMTKWSFTILLLFINYNVVSLAQTDSNNVRTFYDDESFKGHFFTGGSLGLQFGSVTVINAAPVFGYYIWENLAVGTGISYQYINERYNKINLHVLGGSFFCRLYLPFYNSIYAHAEYEQLAFKTNIFSNYQLSEWVFVSNILAGIGYRQKIFNRSSIYISLLWNFNESDKNLSSNPVFRTGVEIGL